MLSTHILPSPQRVAAQIHTCCHQTSHLTQRSCPNALRASSAPLAWKATQLEEGDPQQQAFLEAKGLVESPNTQNTGGCLELGVGTRQIKLLAPWTDLFPTPAGSSLAPAAPDWFLETGPVLLQDTLLPCCTRAGASSLSLRHAA